LCPPLSMPQSGVPGKGAKNMPRRRCNGGAAGAQQTTLLLSNNLNGNALADVGMQLNHQLERAGLTE
jgi:hypothetical protein